MLLLFSAKEIPTKGQLIREVLAERLAEFRSIEEAKCQQKILEKAGELVDSTLIALARLQAKDIVPKPIIPYRPDRPEIKVPKDTTPVQPILPEEQ